jgi:Zn-dependent peptidase ImmA (M78 family)
MGSPTTFKPIRQQPYDFSACVLMPRSSVKYAWASRIQDPQALADLFDVSEQAMRVRLVTLGLLDCSRHDCRRGRRIYRRQEARGTVCGRLAGPPWYDRRTRQ